MVAVDVDGCDELIEQGAAFGVGGGFPDGVEVEFSQDLQDVLELGGRASGLGSGS